MDDPVELESWGEYVATPSKRLRVYIASSLTSEDQTGLREQVLAEAERVFRENGYDVYNPGQHTMPGSPHRPHEVYAIDRHHAMRADLIFFIRCQPSLGMGIEAQIAAEILTPWADVRLADTFEATPLLEGLPVRGTDIRPFFDRKSPEDFSRLLNERLRDTALHQIVLAGRQYLEPARHLVRSIEFGYILRRQRLLLNLSVKELGDRVDMPAWWIEGIERDPELSLAITIRQMARLLEASGLRFAASSNGDSLSGFPRLEASQPVDERLLQRAGEFARYSIRDRQLAEPLPESDDVMLTHWREWSTFGEASVPTASREVASPLVERLTACIALPVSNQDESQYHDLRQQIEDGLRKVSGVKIEASFPEYRRTNRHESGSEIYLKSLERLNDADFGIIVASPPATGVGIMSKLFANATLPCFCLAQDGVALSRMLQGQSHGGTGEVIEFAQLTDIAQLLETAITQATPRLCESAARRRIVSARIAESSIGKSLDRYRIPRRLSHEAALAKFKRVPMVRMDWLEAVATSPAALPSLTLLQFAYIASQLNWRIVGDNSGLPRFHPPIPGNNEELQSEQAHAAEDSLDNLLEAMKYAKRQRLFEVDDSVLFGEWEKYVHELTLSAADYETGQLVRSREQWLQVLFSNPGL